MSPSIEPKKTQESAEPAPAAARPATGAAPIWSAPLVLKLEKSKKNKKKRKKKYSRGTKALQRLLLGVSKAGYRSSNAVSEGLDTFVKRSNKSGRKRRDGMVREALRNASRGFSDGAKEFGKAPRAIAKSIGTRRVWRVFRVGNPLGLFGG